MEYFYPFDTLAAPLQDHREPGLGQMSPMLALRARMQATRLRKFALGSNRTTLIALLTTRKAIALTQALLDLREPIAVVGHRSWMMRRFAQIGRQTKTPLEFWRTATAKGSLPSIVLSFVDQTVGDGPSFRQIEVDDELIAFSTIEVMLAMKFGCRIAVATEPDTTRRLLALQAVHLHWPDIRLPAEVTAEELDRAIARIASPLRRIARAGKDEWYGDQLFAMKTLRGRTMLALSRLAEAEAILRLAPDGTFDPQNDNDLRRYVRDARRQLLECLH